MMCLKRLKSCLQYLNDNDSLQSIYLLPMQEIKLKWLLCVSFHFSELRKILNWNYISIMNTKIVKHIMRLWNISLKSYRLIFRFSLSNHCKVSLCSVAKSYSTYIYLTAVLKKHAQLHEYSIDSVTSYKTQSQPRIIDVKYLHSKFHMYSCPEKVISL